MPFLLGYLMAIYLIYSEYFMLITRRRKQYQVLVVCAQELNEGAVE